MAIQIPLTVASIIPNYLIAKNISLAEVTNFTIAFRLLNIPQTAILSLFPVFWPNFTAAWEKKEFSWLKKWVSRLSLFSLVVITLFGIGGYYVGGWIGELWLGEGIEISPALFIFMGLWLAFKVASEWFHLFLASISDLVYDLGSLVVTLIIAVISVLIFINSMGLSGCALGMATGYCFGSLLPMSFRFLNRLKRKI
jgi:O-antigen/teichoic acid export membrane protein